MADAISLDTAPVDNSVSLDTTVAPINDAAATSRTAKANMGLGPVVQQSYDDIYRQISGGQEDTFRGTAASTMDYKGAENRAKALSTLAGQKGRPLTNDEVQDIISGKPTDQTSVIEKAYAETYARQLEETAKRIDGNVLTTAQMEDPAAVERFFHVTSDVLARREYAISQAQNIQPEVDNDAYFHIPFPQAFGGPIAVGSKTSPIWNAVTGGWSPINWATLGLAGAARNEWLSRGNTPDTPRIMSRTGTFDPDIALEANNVREQAKEILSQPTFEQSKALFDKGFARLKAEDPAKAQEWAMSIAGMSTNEMITRDAMSAANVVFMGGAMRTVKSLLGAAGDKILGRIEPAPPAGPGLPPGPRPVPPSSGNLRQGADGVFRSGPETETNIQEAQRVMEDVLRNTPASPTKANVAEAMGDTHEAAIQKTMVSVVANDPQRDAIDTLFSMHRVNQEAIRRNPGNLSREEHTRLLDAGESSEKNTVDTLVKTTGIVRLPALAETGFRDIADRVKEYFKGPENGIVDYDMYHDDVSKTDHHVLTIGNYDSTPFANKQQAQNAAKIRGFGGATVLGNDIDTVYIPKSAVLHQPLPLSKPDLVEPNPNFVYKKTDAGWRFYVTDGEEPPSTLKGKLAQKKLPVQIENEVQPSTTPVPTYIPFNLKTGKFGQPLAEGPHIIPNGLGYHIKWMIPLNEQDDLIRDKYLVPTEGGERVRSTSSYKSKLNMSFLSYFRLPQDTLSAAENENRGKLVYTQSRYFGNIMNDMKYVQSIYSNLSPTGVDRQRWEDFKRALVVSQKMADPDTGLPGYYMKTPLEIQHFWNSSFNYPATPAQQHAYMAVGRMDYQDWVYRNVGMYLNKSRLGVMTHSISDQPAFEGRFITKLPEGDIPVMIHSKDGSVKWYNSMSRDGKRDFREDFKTGQSGYRGVQLYSPDTYPVKVFDADKNPVRVVYVVSNAMTSTPLTYQQVGYRGGGHWDYNYDHYIKQPVMRMFKQGGKTHWVYEGDATFAPIKNHIDGEVFISNLNKIIGLLKDKKVAEAKAVHKAYSDQNWADFVKGFYPRKNKDTGELMAARFNLHEKFRILPKGFTTPEYDKGFVNKYKALPNSKFVNAANGEQSLARNYQVEYTGTRDSHDLFEPYNTGTVTNPLYKFQPAELVDPLVAQQRALRRIISSVAGDSMKYTAVEHWIQENMDLLDVHSKAEARHSPFSTFMNTNLTRLGTGSLRGQAAMTNRYKIQKLIGMPTFMDSQIHMLKQAFADDVFEGSKIAIPASWTLGKINSPVSFLRGMAFHENLGLFNWMQLASQNAAYINFFALSPGHAIPGTFGALMHQWSRINKGESKLVKGADGIYRPSTGSIVAAMDKKAQKFGWKPGEFIEAMHLYEKTGFDKIGQTMAFHDEDVNFLLGNANKVLATGSKYFFELAEQNVKHGAWYTAFHEYKRAYPNKKIDDLEIGKILSRANNLYMNMGRDSKTLLTTGVTSMTLQFFKYQENVTHEFLSKRIGDAFGKENTLGFRMAQRARMIAAYSFMFGATGALGLGLIPSDLIRKQALNAGYVPGEHWYSSLLMEGPASMAGAYLSGWWRTGNVDMSKGTFYNYNNRYGVNNSIIKDLLEGDKTFWQFVLGASGSTLATNLSTVSPFVYAWKSAWNDEQSSPFEISMSDWRNGADQIKSFKSVDRLTYALAFGKWLDSHGRLQQDVGAIDAIYRSVLGVNDVKLDDLNLLRQIKEDRTVNYKQAAQDFLHYYRLRDQAVKNKDDAQATIYGNNALFVLKSRDLPIEEVAKILSQAKSLNTNTQDAAYDDFYNRAVPKSQQADMLKAYQEIHRQKH